MNLIAGVTITPGEQVTRQTLYDVWANAGMGAVGANDLGAGVLPIIVGSQETTSAQPGAVWYDQTELLWKCYFDQVDNTGCSLWLSFGADRFDEAFLAAEPIPPGSAVRIDTTMGNRWVRRTAGYNDGSVIGFSQKPNTAASGTWFVGGVEGVCWGWFAIKPTGNTETGNSTVTLGAPLIPISWAPGAMGIKGSGTMNISCYVYGVPLCAIAPNTTVSGGNGREKFIFTGPRYAKS